MHGSPRLNFFGRLLLVQRVEAGWSLAAASEAVGVSRATGHKWIRRYREEGEPGLEYWPSRPHRSPARLSAEQEAPVLELRRERKLGPHRIAALTRLPRSTCHK